MVDEVYRRSGRGVFSTKGKGDRRKRCQFISRFFYPKSQFVGILTGDRRSDLDNCFSERTGQGQIINKCFTPLRKIVQFYSSSVLSCVLLVGHTTCHSYLLQRTDGGPNQQRRKVEGGRESREVVDLEEREKSKVHTEFYTCFSVVLLVWILRRDSYPV